MTDIQQCRALVNLGPWLDRCERAGVPYVPAVWSEAFPVAELYRALSVIGLMDSLLVEHAPGVIGAFEWLAGQREEAVYDRRQMMARWECCSPCDTKYRMEQGGGWGASMMYLTLDDPRLFDCLASDTLRICVRPWVEAMRVEGYPVEFRVFYGPHGWQGTSSYYPQRPLQRDVVNEMLMDQCRNYADRFYEGEHFPVGFTADFLVMPDFQVLFLEGGPPHVLGPVSAHPCCFPPGKVRGLALKTVV